MLSPCIWQVTHALLTRPPLGYAVLWPKSPLCITPFDLHVLSTPPAFILSQDQTLVKIVCFPSRTTSLAIPSVLTVLGLSALGSPHIWAFPSQTVLWNSYESSGLHYCLVFKVRFVCFPRRNSDIISSAVICVKTFFRVFKTFSCRLRCFSTT